jgi:acyl carrier protein
MSFIEKKSRLLKASEIQSNTTLFSSGALDSLAFVQLVAFIDKEFQIKLSSVTALTMNNLDNLDMIGQKISKALQTKEQK